MPVPVPPKGRPRLRKLAREPWSKSARRSPALAVYCARRGYLTPNYTVREMADTQTGVLPSRLRGNARRHCFNLERLRHALGDVPVPIDGPTRTEGHNRQVGGARLSRHVQGDASDHFLATVDRIVKASPVVDSRADVVQIAERIFAGVGNERSGTLHLDSRPGSWVRFVTWRSGS